MGDDPTDMPYDYVLGRAVTDLQTFVGWGKRFYTPTATTGAKKKKSGKGKGKGKGANEAKGDSSRRLSVQAGGGGGGDAGGGGEGGGGGGGVEAEDVGLARWGVSRGILYMQSREIEDDLAVMRIDPARVTYTKLGDLLIPKSSTDSSTDMTTEGSTVTDEQGPTDWPVRGVTGGGEATPTPAPDFSSLTVPVLKDMCRAKGLVLGGRKAELVERLHAAASAMGGDGDGDGVGAGDDAGGDGDGAGAGLEASTASSGSAPTELPPGSQLVVTLDDPRLIMAADPELGYSSVLHLPRGCL